MLTNSKISSLKSLLTFNKHKPFSSNSTYLHLNKEIFESADTEIIKEYLKKIMTFQQILIDNKIVLVFPNLAQILNFTYSDKISEIKNKKEIIFNIKNFSKILRNSGIKIYFSIDIYQIFSLEKFIQRIKDFNQNNLVNENFWNDYTHKKGYNISDFIKTKELNLSLDTKGQNPFKRALGFVCDFYKSSFVAEGIFIENIQNYLFQEQKNNFEEKIIQINDSFKFVQRNLKIKFVAFNKFYANSQINQKMFKLSFFNDFIYDLQIHDFNSSSKLIFEFLAELNKMNVSFNYNNSLDVMFFQNFHKSNFYFVEIIKSYVALNCLLSKSSDLSMIFNISSFSPDTQECLFEDFSLKKDIIQKRINIEQIFFDVISQIKKIILESDLSVSEQISVNYYNKYNLNFFKLKTETAKEYLIIFNSSKSLKRLNIDSQFNLLYSTNNTNNTNVVRPFELKLLIAK
ncbi:hypothetical protein V2E24_00240 [Mycoplasmopsis ciconiae]|uniref:Uncharacterized protein n=1 Tax=Mycoplasmopsis ciconiae TaxID=561067 RepID=A0ABU7MLT6_9BACT|nr:hypothetical protein [Mycoplasmopsis ciconiae]